MARFQGKRVSKPWSLVLRAAARDGVHFTLNSGRRTMKEQWALFNQNMQKVGARWVPKPGRPITAFPSPTAPHIRVGRPDHALDVSTVDGGESRLERWLDERGFDWRNTVSTEAWHGEVDGAQLVHAAKRLAHLLKLNDDEWSWVREFDRLKAQDRNAERRARLREQMRRRRKDIWRKAEAQKGGWRKFNRRVRYHILLDRTT